MHGRKNIESNIKTSNYGYAALFYCRLKFYQITQLTLPSLDSWDWEFESRRGHGYLSLVNVVYCIG